VNNNEKKLKLMRFWLFGTFLIIFIAATTYVGGALGTGLLIFGQVRFWLAFIITAILCVAAYYVYKWYLEKDK